MRIAQISPLFESVPPLQYGGTERIVSYLTEELVRQGHQVTLFAAGDSKTSAQLHATWPSSLRLHGGYTHQNIPHLMMLDQILESSGDFDILHFHIDGMHYPFLKYIDTPSITTIHDRMDHPRLVPFYKRYSPPLVSISRSQRTPLPFANWKGTVHHGLPKNLYQLNEKPKGYAAFLGRVSPEKGLPRAIEIAERMKVPLKIAAKIDPHHDQFYFETEIKSLLEQSQFCEFVGEINDSQKNEFLGNANVLLFPIDWPEPFGLVMIEAMACGTPVLAYGHGSVPEVMENGVTGFIVHDMDEAIQKMDRIPSLSRRKCREVFERRFTAETMARNYVEIYSQIIDSTINDGYTELWKTSSKSITSSI